MNVSRPCKLPEPNLNAAVELVMDLMSIPGRSGEEGQVAEFITQKLTGAGLAADHVVHDTAHRRSPRGGQVGNLIVKLPGTIAGPRRLLMAHMDTVPLCVGCKPVRKGNLVAAKDSETALGADNRAGCAVILLALMSILKNKHPHPPLTFLWTIEAEVGLLGARHVAIGKLGGPKLCFNWDGRQPWLVCVGATGDDHIDIEVDGIPSHAGVHPELGVNSASIASLAIADLVQNGWLGLVKKGRHSGTSNIGAIEGGQATNVVMPRLTIRAEARSHDPKFRAKIVSEIRKAFERAAKSLKADDGRRGAVRFQSLMKYESFLLDQNEPSILAAEKAVEMVGLQPERSIGNGGLDANWMSAHGLPTVTLGCGQQDIHTANETLDIAGYESAIQIAFLLATAGED